MAGFDFDFRYKDDLNPYVEACLRAAKSRARQLGCRWRVFRLDNGVLRCVVDGQTRLLDLLGRALVHDLPTVCEGVSPGLPPKQARQVGHGFAELFNRGRDSSRDDEVQVLRRWSAQMTYFPLFDFADVRKWSSALRARLQVTEDVVTDYGLDRYPPVILLEELHTALEHTFRELLPSVRPRATWPELRSAAAAQGLLPWSRGDWSREVGHSHSDDELLDALARRRNASKHQRANPNESWLSDHWQCVALLLERLVRHL